MCAALESGLPALCPGMSKSLAMPLVICAMGIIQYLNAITYLHTTYEITNIN